MPKNSQAMKKQVASLQNRADCHASTRVNSLAMTDCLHGNDSTCWNDSRSPRYARDDITHGNDIPTASLKKVRGLHFITTDTIYDEMDSPVGKLTIIASPRGLHAVLWGNDLQDLRYSTVISRLKRSEDNPIIIKTKKQLNEYFQGKRKVFDLPLKPDGTDFQIQAWEQLSKIPYATTISYKTQAERVGDKNKARAVGMANGKNPISIIIPCHRVVGSNGDLVGFAGGLDKKEYLLKLEKMYL